MPKLISYACDKCNESTEYEELAPIYVYCFEIDLEEPKILEYEFVCQNCREQFAAIVKGWIV